jgi:hypothetical protein
MINLDVLIGLVFGAGGIFSVSGFIKYRDWSRNSKLKLEDTHVTRLEEENKRALKRADDAEERADKAEEKEAQLRERIAKQSDQIAEYRGRLIQANLLRVNPDDQG